MSQDKFIGSILDGRYEILEKIGEGGMAYVYKAFCHKLHRNVAIKIMRDDIADDSSFVQRMYDEANAAAALTHNSIVSIYDVGTNDELDYIVMELIDGITLKQYIEAKGILSNSEVIHFSRQICSALSYAHSCGIIHRDIKPQNIMLLKDGTIKVADFGIAAVETELSSNENESSAVGSVFYMSPEEIKGEQVNCQTDIYSLGIMMYEMLTGRVPYTGNTFGEIALKHLGGDPKPIYSLNGTVPDFLEDIVIRAISPDINSRYKTADEMIADLTEAASKLPDSPEQPAIDSKYIPDVLPVRSISELSKEKFKIRRRRSMNVSFSSGAFLGIAATIAVFIFFWSYWLKDIFSAAVRIEIPDFISQNYSDVSTDVQWNSQFNFIPEYVVNTDYESGYIMAQNPVAGRSLMTNNEGIDVNLTIATGIKFEEIPELGNLNYKEAQLQLEQMGFSVEILSTTSSEVDKDKVIYTSPAAGEKISLGSTVYITISSGTEHIFTTMPNLIGYTETAAINKLQNCNLSYGGSDTVSSILEAGTVVGQSYTAYATVEEYTKIYLTISSGETE